MSAELARRVATWCETHQVPRRVFGLEVGRDPALYGQLLRGRQPGRKLAERIEKLLAGDPPPTMARAAPPVGRVSQMQAVAAAAQAARDDEPEVPASPTVMGLDGIFLAPDGQVLLRLWGSSACMTPSQAVQAAARLTGLARLAVALLARHDVAEAGAGAGASAGAGA